MAASTLIAASGGDPLLALVLVLLGGGLVTGYVAARRAGPQNTLDTVQSMKILADELRSELDRAEARLQVLEARVATCEDERDMWQLRALQRGWVPKA